MLTFGIPAALLTTFRNVYLQDYKPAWPSGTSVRFDFAGYSYSPDGGKLLLQAGMKDRTLLVQQPAF